MQLLTFVIRLVKSFSAFSRLGKAVAVHPANSWCADWRKSCQSAFPKLYLGGGLLGGNGGCRSYTSTMMGRWSDPSDGPTLQVVFVAMLGWHKVTSGAEGDPFGAILVGVPSLQ